MMKRRNVSYPQTTYEGELSPVRFDQNEGGSSIKLNGAWYYVPEQQRGVVGGAYLLTAHKLTARTTVRSVHAEKGTKPEWVFVAPKDATFAAWRDDPRHIKDQDRAALEKILIDNPFPLERPLVLEPGGLFTVNGVR